MVWKIIEENRKLREKETRIFTFPKSGAINGLLVYPNSYQIGMSSLGFQRVYNILNEIPGVYCDRAFMPHFLTLKNIEKKILYAVETEWATGQFDFIGFSISYELDIFNVLKFLNLSSIPLRGRGENFPLIIAGGAITLLNFAPLSDFIDIFVVGESETTLPLLMEIIKEKHPRKKILEKAAQLPGIYVPVLKNKINYMPLEKLNFKSHSVILSPCTEFQNTFLVEINRGCPYKCKFCMMGNTGKPARFRTYEDIINDIEFGRTFSAKIGLLGSAPASHPQIEKICEHILENNLRASFSSLRVEKINETILKVITNSRQNILTIAPETGSNKLRSQIGKPISDEVFLDAAENASKSGISKLRLYFMIGLPDETLEDIYAIASLTEEIAKIQSLNKIKNAEIILSINPFIPKNNTFFGDRKFEKREIIEEKQKILKKLFFKIPNTKINFEPYYLALWQAVLAKADTGISEILEKTYLNSMKKWDYLDENEKSYINSFTG